jgi:hypothetical protein
MQYKLRNVPVGIDQALRTRAKAEGKTINQVALEALQAGLELNGKGPPKRDLSFMGRMDDATLNAIEDVRASSERVWPDEDR